ncbi:2-phosphosulfolactate phosphatase [Actinophytocola glycyrrhizae]|uniref:2-phosphosulfolactate phosphatase n=1 Tax=Actinophytocola glycyrrhizae TaxID=2044873 RepID=UPI003A8DFE9E
MTVFEQDGCDLRVEWGLDGVHALGPHCAVLVVVDVLVFTTTVDVALGRGARVLPLPWRDERAAAMAEALGAVLTPPGLDESYGQPGWTLRPSSLTDLPAGTLLGIASPNGATLAAAAAETGTAVLAGCLRNASAVAAAASAIAEDRPVGVIAAGERWRPERTLRPSIEDYLGAGAIAAAVTGRSAPSSEATLAAVSYRAVRDRIPALLGGSISGRELIAAGVPEDVALATDVDVSTVVPVLDNGVFTS